MISNSFTSYLMLFNSSKFIIILNRGKKKKINVVEIKKNCSFFVTTAVHARAYVPLKVPKNIYLFIYYLLRVWCLVSCVLSLGSL